MTEETNHLVGLLLGTEEDWPTAFETLVSRLGPIKDAGGATRTCARRTSSAPTGIRGCGSSRPPSHSPTAA